MSTMTTVDVAWAQTLRAEGMPCSWIADGTPFTPGQVRAATRAPKGAGAAWKTTWAQIEKHKELLAMHREFAPRGVLR